MLLYKKDLFFITVIFSYISFSACPFQFRFAILVACFKSNSLQHSSVYSERITIPTLHVFGDTDQVIPKGKNYFFLMQTLLSLLIDRKSCDRRHKSTIFSSFFYI